MTRRIVLATRNEHKIVEVQRILSGLDIEIVPVERSIPDVPETGSSFAANALLKAHAVSAATGLPAIADDSGLCVDALNGMPGIFSARWAGQHGDDRANLELVLAQTADVPDARRGAQFVCAAAYVDPDGAEHVVEGVLEGRLAREPRGRHGFGYDPIFLPETWVLTTAELTPAEKDAVSHRGRAFRALAEVLA